MNCLICGKLVEFGAEGPSGHTCLSSTCIFGLHRGLEANRRYQEDLDRQLEAKDITIFGIKIGEII
jgi:hypothetical protein